MKIIILIMLVSLSFPTLTSCSKNDNSNPIVYNDKGINVSLNNSTWYTKVNYNQNGLWFGNIHLKVNGKTNADNVYIQTYGDGLTGWFPLEMDSLKSFNQDLEISFTHFDSSPTGKTTTSSTFLMALKGTDTLNVELKSGTLTY